MLLFFLNWSCLSEIYVKKKYQFIAIKIYVEILSLLPSILGQNTASTRPIHSYDYGNDYIFNNLPREKTAWQYCLTFSHFSFFFLFFQCSSSVYCYVQQFLCGLHLFWDFFLFLSTAIDFFLDSDSFYNCIPHFSNGRSNYLL